jgi:hypothetical protein
MISERIWSVVTVSELREQKEDREIFTVRLRKDRTSVVRILLIDM